MRARLLPVLGLAAGLAPAWPAAAQTLRMAFDSEWTAVDPHFHSYPQNLSVAHHVFDALVEVGPDSRVRPKLATSWRAVDPLTWEFTLRDGVTFHDGSEFGAEDVAASIERVPKVPNSPGSLTPQIRAIKGMEVKDRRTIAFKLGQPEPLLPELLSDIYIVPSELKDATTEDFNTGKAAIGTGAFRLGGWSRGDRLTLRRHDGYWGDKPAWKEVDIRVITNAATREVSLLSGEVDFIQSPSTSSLKRIEADPKIVVHKVPSTRITYLQVDQNPAPKSDLSVSGGRNPFADVRARRAVSMAIPRQAIAERIMDGLALPASQLVPPGHPGHAPAVKLEPYDLAGAKQLLAEAGFPDGFAVTLSTPNDRNVNGVKVAEAIAQSLARIGIKVTVNAVPLPVYLTAWRKGSYGMVMHGAGPPPATLLLLPQLAGSKNEARALGRSNESGYGNPKLDDVLVRLGQELDGARAEGLVREAAAVIRDDVAVVPLHHEMVVWASRRGLDFAARGDARTWATGVAPAKSQ